MQPAIVAALAPCHACRSRQAVVRHVPLAAGSRATGTTSHGCTREEPRSQPSSARSGSSARQPSSRPQHAGAGQLTENFLFDMRRGSLPKVLSTLRSLADGVSAGSNTHLTGRVLSECSESRRSGMRNSRFGRHFLDLSYMASASVVIAILSLPSVCTEGRAHDGDLHDSEVLGAGRTPDAAQAARMQVRLDTGHVLPVCLRLLNSAREQTKRVALCEPVVLQLDSPQGCCLLQVS